MLLKAKLKFYFKQKDQEALHLEKSDKKKLILSIFLSFIFIVLINVSIFEFNISAYFSIALLPILIFTYDRFVLLFLRLKREKNDYNEKNNIKSIVS